LFIFTSLKHVVTPYFCESLISLAFKVSELIAKNLMMLFKNIYIGNKYNTHWKGIMYNYIFRKLLYFVVVIKFPNPP